MLRPALFVLTLCCAHPALSAPAPGQPFPDVTGLVVTGEERTLASLLQGERTLLVAITDRDAADGMRAWFDAADARAPGINRVSIISIELPGWISDGYALDQAKGRVPERWWEQTLFDTDQALAERLGLIVEDPEEPWAFVLDARGRVVARVRGGVDAPRADRVLKALSGR